MLRRQVAAFHNSQDPVTPVSGLRPHNLAVALSANDSLAQQHDPGTSGYVHLKGVNMCQPTVITATP
jgi:hypothetical protein